jgi:hypothetical protein
LTPPSAVSENTYDLVLMDCLMPSKHDCDCKPFTRQALLQAMVRWVSADATERLFGVRFEQT